MCVSVRLSIYSNTGMLYRKINDVQCKITIMYTVGEGGVN